MKNIRNKLLIKTQTIGKNRMPKVIDINIVMSKVCLPFAGLLNLKKEQRNANETEIKDSTMAYSYCLKLPA